MGEKFPKLEPRKIIKLFLSSYVFKNSKPPS
ncbi:hypothetical protein AAA799P11_01483 [Marine Group I thaumarchaeote SCGC AAA799-P11]|uniref:Uncharacterized protein n=1 Tax=Marine Group I thaumarchaeote SCGC AAA799-P11 TaxID=1502295 RepID=A0A087RQG5_9ARCH|nr:hypothetical protein AAA799P11_01483 [Marine Group I thaumarchaeote SCGC AAA799-P11]